MPKVYKNRTTADRPIRFRQAAEPVYYPQIIGQQANASFVDYSNPRRREIAIYPGAPIAEYQKALDSLNTIDGGTLILKEGTHILNNITLESYSFVNIVGVGIDKTILEFGGTAGGLNLKGTAAAVKSNAVVRDFTLQNSNNVAGIDIDYFDNFTIDNVKVASCDQKGIRINHSQFFLLINTLCSSNTGNGFEVLGRDSRATTRFSFFSCTGDSNTANGFVFSNDASVSRVNNFTLINCQANGNTTDGFDFNSTSAGDPLSLECVLIGCMADVNGGIGFDFNIRTARILIIGCLATSNTGDGFELDASDWTMIGNETTEEYDLNTLLASSNRNIFLGNRMDTGATINPSVAQAIDQGIVISLLNAGEGTRNEMRFMRMKNTAGTSVTVGDVVVRKAVATGDEITTTTTGGDDLVFGIALATIADTEWGSFQTIGLNTSVKVDGTTDIAIGDFLSTFTTAKIAKKASAGDAVFAIALEAYATDDSLGVIDALIIPVRLI